ncbi:hypothetical protein N480_19395 [Pseudoalteromonas luteoviolacea S2607]|uniref:hypothetical protein n=1 Tax=Pseudoalteromonas luteoviolacea TaxID=43657 RepID=UPI0007B03818|nr:hypothetical protein [Pseudoalteromonas luteoviolacea]KZN35211.1 hypothetical protein N480_19395 [Pseudoalteromonas luteoviolacea S2607]
MHLRVFLLVLLIPVPAYANMIWPALYLETRLFSWWAITLGLVIEYLFVRKLYDVPIIKAVLATIGANLVSAVVGIVLIPLAGIVWEIFPGILFYKVLGMGTFNPITWTATFILACLVNLALEGLVYKKVFKLPFQFKSKLSIWFFLANTVSVGVAFASLFIVPVRM